MSRIESLVAYISAVKIGHEEICSHNLNCFDSGDIGQAQEVISHSLESFRPVQYAAGIDVVHAYDGESAVTKQPCVQLKGLGRGVADNGLSDDAGDAKILRRRLTAT